MPVLCSGHTTERSCVEWGGGSGGSGGGEGTEKRDKKNKKEKKKKSRTEEVEQKKKKNTYSQQITKRREHGATRDLFKDLFILK